MENEIRRFDRNELRGTLGMTLISFLLDDIRVFKDPILKNYLFGLYDGFDYSDDIVKLSEKAFEGDIRTLRLALDLAKFIKTLK
jgi:hypothetical protein